MENYDQFVDILSMILATMTIVALLIWSIYAIICQLKTEELRKKYIDSLKDDHEKAVILDYQQIKYRPFKKRD